jgi:hypothetical protein
VKLKTIEQFIIESVEIHDDTYDYSMADYKNGSTKISIVCKIHGVFLQTPRNHLSGYGCNKCGIKAQAKKVSKSISVFLEEASKKHDNFYDYSLITEYQNNREKLSIICPIHDIFYQDAASHLRGYGCSSCGLLNSTELFSSQKKTTEQFIQESVKIHSNLYDYSLTNYIRIDMPVVIICNKHGNFSQKALCHLQGKGCPKCSKKISKPERKWLSYMNIPDDRYHRQVRIYVDDKWYVADGFDPNTNTIFEFLGDYWHGNPEKYVSDDTNEQAHKTFGELYRQTQNKEAILKKAGYNVISIWENDWIAIGKSNEIY